MNQIEWFLAEKTTPRSDKPLIFTLENERICSGYYNPEDGYYYECGSKYKAKYYTYLEDLPIPRS